MRTSIVAFALLLIGGHTLDIGYVELVRHRRYKAASGQYEQWVLEGGGTITTPWAKTLEADTGILAQIRDPRNAEQAAQMPAGARILSLSGPRDRTPEEFAAVKKVVLDKVEENNVTGEARSTAEHKAPNVSSLSAPHEHHHTSSTTRAAPHEQHRTSSTTRAAPHEHH